MKHYLQALRLPKQTLQRLDTIDADNLSALASYLDAVGEQLSLLLDDSEQGRVREALSEALSEREKSALSEPIPRTCFGARLDRRR